MPITKEQARDLARALLDMSHALGEYRFENWDALGPAQRKSIEDLEWSLLNLSGDVTTHVVGAVLDGMDADLKALRDATARARKVVAQIERAKDLIALATKAVALGGALVSQHPVAIADAARDLYDAAGKLA